MTGSRLSRGGRIILAAAFGVAFQLSDVARAAGPRERVEDTVTAISAVLGDQRLRGPEHERERKDRVRGIIHQAFYFTHMAEDALGRHWAELGAEQRDEFVGLFRDLFERSYDRLVLRFLGESRTTYGAESIERDRALVHTTLVREHDDEIPVDYHLTSDGRRWAMADVDVDGVSLAANFRSQFEKTIRSTSLNGLIAKIRSKLAEGD